MEQMLTVRQCADMLGVSRMTVYRLIHDGALRSVKIRESFRVPESAVREYVDR